ncbi:MAG: DUF512 domain-containing protein [Acutalibacteraceae bacterium]|nr:DUF512 domain-containing protein [Acutalibacteraceae bacterium]
MSVIIKDVEKKSPAYKAGIKSGDTLLTLNGNTIMDVLDYRFYQSDEKLTAEIINSKGKIKKLKIKKDEFQELGLLFDTYLMDQKHSCKNKCIFCFIDQLPKGLRESLYFKDDDSRLSFLFGNYITLTNITEHEIERIIKMHISPINISVHTTNPELRVKMMTNKNAGKALDVIKRFNDAGIKMNSQLVLCPGYNDGAELERTLNDLLNLENMECIAAVPVGLTKYRDGLAKLEPFNKENASSVLDIIDKYAQKSLEKYASRRIYGSDEFYLLAEREIPSAEFYGDFLQLENGVGLWALLKSEAYSAIKEVGEKSVDRHISIATGVSAYPLIRDIADKCEQKCKGLKCDVYAIKNNFFGEKITVSGLITATDIYEQLKDTDLGETLYIPSSMLRDGGDMFLDSITLDELSDKLNVKIKPIDNEGYLLVDAIIDG